MYNILGTTFRFVIPLPEDPPADAVEFVTTGFDHWGGAGWACDVDPLRRPVTRDQCAAGDQTL
ncbi:MAG: hypothetical protein HY763_16705 [Planctomycetes bacterium]|nr:hypothetical protein [Planctomycetota bacterium]